MSKIVTNKFSGEKPKTTPGLLSSDHAQMASNVNISRGDIRAWKAPERISTLNLEAIQTIFQYEENGNSNWVEFASVVNYILSPMADDQYERLYMTGGDTFEPRFFANNLVSGDFDQNTAFLKLGIPAPTSAPTVVTGGGGSTYRAYIYCYINEYGDQGPPSDLGSDSDWGSGYVTVGNILDAPTDRAIDKIYIYRTNSGSAGTAEFQFICEATWFSTSASYAVGDYVIYLNDLYKCTTNHSAGAWNLGNFTKGENVDDGDLGEVIPSYYISGSNIITYEPPPPNMEGLIVLPNGVAVGFVGNQLYLSEPYMVHAWPLSYSISGFGSQIIGLGFFGTTIVVLTNSYPYVVFGNHPSAMTKRRIASLLPCIRNRSIAVGDDSVFYASGDGLVQINQAGAGIVTSQILDKDNWEIYLPNLHGEYYAGKYFGFYTSGGIVIDFVNNEMTTLRVISQAEHVSLGDSKMYVVMDDQDAFDENNPPENIPLCVKEWEGSDVNYLYYTWTSKVYIMNSSVNFSLAQILVDKAFYDLVGDSIDLEEENAALFAQDLEGSLGSNVIGGRTLCSDTLTDIGGISFSGAITFKLYADNELKFTKTVSGLNNTFTLPDGFTGKRYYYEVSGYIPIIPPVKIVTTRDELMQ